MPSTRGFGSIYFESTRGIWAEAQSRARLRLEQNGARRKSAAEAGDDDLVPLVDASGEVRVGKRHERACGARIGRGRDGHLEQVDRRAELLGGVTDDALVRLMGYDAGDIADVGL